MMKRRGLLVGVGAALGVPAAWAQSSLLRIGFQKSAVNLLSSVLDTPLWFWTQPD